MTGIDAIDPGAVDLLGVELQLQLFAHHSGQEAAHRMLLPPVAFIIAAIVVPPGEDNSAMTRDCFESGSIFLIFGSPVVSGAASAARADGEVGAFFLAFDIEILRSMQRGIIAASPKPHLGDQAGGAGSLSAFSARDWRQYRSVWAGRPVLSG